jgi:RNA polymerase sigma-70 factor (ECF subfamily)
MSTRTGTPDGCCSHDEARFGELYRRYYRPVRDYCRRRVAADAVDDVVAEVFLRVWRRLADVPAGRDALVWLYGVAYRAIGHH